MEKGEERGSTLSTPFFFSFSPLSLSFRSLFSQKEDSRKTLSLYIEHDLPRATCGIPSLDILAWLKKIRPKWSLSGKTSACLGKFAPPESTM